jgi:hypothetical protein
MELKNGKWEMVDAQKLPQWIRNSEAEPAQTIMAEEYE